MSVTHQYACDLCKDKIQTAAEAGYHKGFGVKFGDRNNLVQSVKLTALGEVPTHICQGCLSGLKQA